MILREIIDFDRPRDVDTLHKQVVRRSMSKSRQLGYLGSGAQTQAYSYTSPTKPNIVVKHTFTTKNPNDDPHVNFLKIAIKHQDNPHFPKIYSLKIYTTRHNASEVIYTTEKLLRLTTKLLVNDQDIHPDDDWSRKYPDDAGFTYGGLSILKQLGIEITNVNDVFRKFEDDISYDEIIEKTKSPSFREALQLIKPLFNDFMFDLHHGNLMVRLTSVGPQLVIVDPVYAGNHPGER